MIQLIVIVFCIFLFAVSLSLFSKSAEQRAKSRTDLYYAMEIKEEASAIRLQNMRMILDISKDNSLVIEEEKIEKEMGTSEEYEEEVELPNESIELKEVELDEKGLEFASKFQPKQEEIDLRKENSNSSVEMTEFELGEKGLEFVNKIQPEQEEYPLHEENSRQLVEMKEVELEVKDLEFASKFQLEQKEIDLHKEIIRNRKTVSWFNFPEVDLLMNRKPENGLFYVAGKVMDVLDEMSAIISDGTGERLLYHHKVQNLSMGNIIIAQVQIHNCVWNFVNVWEINQSESTYPVGEEAM